MLLQAPHRRKGDDAIADMVKLDGEDLADAVALDERAAGDGKLRRLVLDGKVVVLLRQTGVKKRIARDKDVPPFAVEGGRIVGVVEGGPADHLGVDQRGGRGM